MRKKTKIRVFSDIIVKTPNQIFLFNEMAFNEENEKVEVETLYKFGVDEIKSKFNFSDLTKWIPNTSSLASAVVSTGSTALFKNWKKQFEIELRIDKDKTLNLQEGKMRDSKAEINKSKIQKKIISLKNFAKLYLS